MTLLDPPNHVCPRLMGADHETHAGHRRKVASAVFTIGLFAIPRSADDGGRVPAVSCPGHFTSDPGEDAGRRESSKTSGLEITRRTNPKWSAKASTPRHPRDNLARRFSGTVEKVFRLLLHRLRNGSRKRSQPPPVRGRGPRATTNSPGKRSAGPDSKHGDHERLERLMTIDKLALT